MIYLEEQIGVVIPMDAEELVVERMTGYSSYVLETRSMPGLIDGFKYVYRRAVFSASHRSEKLIKSALLVGSTMGYHPHGDCLRGDTKVPMADGSTATIKELYDNGVLSVDTLAKDKHGSLVTSRATNIRIGQTTDIMYRVNLINGGLVECTGNHPFKVLHHGWVKSENLVEGMIIDYSLADSIGRYTDRRSSKPIGQAFSTRMTTQSSLNPLLNNYVSMVSSNSLSPYTITNPSPNLEQEIKDRLKDIPVVSSVEMIKLEEPEDFYDFTDSTHENMMIVTGTDQYGNPVLGCVHNSSIYGAIVAMTTPGKARIFRGKGNFGSIVSSPAAMRYTEAFLEGYGRFMYTKYVDYVEMVEGDIGLMEPKALPAMIPYALIAGSSGTGVGEGTSPSIASLNLMGLIDYFIDLINKVEVPRVPFPDVGNVILDMDDAELIQGVSDISFRLRTRSIITRETSTTLVINELHNRKISQVLRKVQKLIDDGVLDYRDESTSKEHRYVFEVVHHSVDIDDLYNILSNATVAHKTFTRIFSHESVAYRCDLRYQCEKSLNYYKSAVQNYFDKEEKRLRKKLDSLKALDYLIKSGLAKRLTDITEEEVYVIMRKEGFSDESIGGSIARSIKLLTSKSGYDQELLDVQKELDDLLNIDFTEYLVSEYEELRELVRPLYDSVPHSIPKSALLTGVTTARLSGNQVTISNRSGKKFKRKIAVIYPDGFVSTEYISSQVRAVFDYSDEHHGNPIGICTDDDDYGLIVCSGGGFLAIDMSKDYNKVVVRLDEGDSVKDLVNAKGNDYGVTNPGDLVRSRISKPIYV